MRLLARTMAKAEVLIIDKKEGMTSFSSLSSIKREYGERRIGHAGTLDKFASGLMIVLVGQATRLNPIFSSMGKSYIAELTFGKETDTLDPEGAIIREAPLPAEETLRTVLRTFIGEQKQIPPQYSALHVNGRRAYKEARSGRELQMPERDITIDSIDLLSFDGEKAVISAAVSKGTYIRALARDIGERCGSAAFVSALRRISIGPFTLSDIGQDTKTLLDKTGLFSAIVLDESHRKEIENGCILRKWILSDSAPQKQYAYLYFDALFAFGEKKEGKISIMGRF